MWETPSVVCPCAELGTLTFPGHHLLHPTSGSAPNSGSSAGGTRFRLARSSASSLQTCFGCSLGLGKEQEGFEVN